MRATRAWKYIFILLILTRVNSRRLEAQSGTSSAISGTVTDASGDVIANASVTATETNTKAIRTGKTDVSGHYLFSQVNPGTYQVVVRAAGFAAAASKPTPVEVGRNVALNFSIHPASSQTGGRGDGTTGAFESQQFEHHDHHRSQDHQEPAQSRPGFDLPHAVRARSIDEHRRFLQRCEGCRRLWQC